MKYILFICSFLVSFPGFEEMASAADVRPVSKRSIGNCLSFDVLGNKAVFFCEDSIKVQVEQLGSGIMKISYDHGDPVSPGESFAVIKKGDGSERMNISEQARGYEIYTGHLIVRISKSPFQIRIFDKYQKLLMEDFQDQGFVFDSMSMCSYKSLKPGENIYGLGEKNGSLNRTGSTFKMWNSDKPCYQYIDDPLYKSIPFFMSSEGYGIYFDNTHKTQFDFGRESEGKYSFSTPGGEMIYYFMYGPTFKQILTRYIELTGKAIMPPDWAFGFSQCRGLLTNEKLTREIAAGYRERQIPCDIIYQDIGWTRYLQDFEWREENYDDPVKMIEDLKQDGFKVVVSQDPVISQVNQAQWKEADSLGYLATDARTGKTYDMPWPWGGNCGLVDFTNPKVADWWGAYQQKPIDDGARGFWTDMGEPAWSNEENTDRLFMRHHMGSHDEIHNVYGLNWDRVVSEQFGKRNPNTRIFQMTRSGFAGMQRYSFGWSGDAGNGNNVSDGWDQLAAQIPLSMSAGMGLIPFWSCDISGYCGDIEDYQAMRELYIRWLQFGAFNPLSRIHHEGNNAVEPWLFGEEAAAICKSAIEGKYRLFPYIYTYAREAYDKGWPLIRALVLEYPEDPEVFNMNNQFLFGGELLVAPVVEEGEAIKRIYLPEGEWIDYNDKRTCFQGNQWINYKVTLEQIPLFVKKGSIIPQMPVMQYINEYPGYPLILEVFQASANRNARFVVYEDNGESNDYKKDLYVKREFQCTSKPDRYEISCHEVAENHFQPVSRDLIYKLHLDEKPLAVRLSGRKLKASGSKHMEETDFEPVRQAAWSWDEGRSQCIIRIPATAATEIIGIEI
ncbi:MAG: TIM-barrel domain-containing protein [Bacteroidota bacterium]